ncbi:MAG: hypothetical protein IT563_22735 [Alphaproteobacteria bacterium]|nr:hypothetical protein [Alphaproteobacteria bacterium]
MTDTLKIVPAQLNAMMGDVESIAVKLLAARAEAARQGVDLVMPCERVISAYPPEDHVLKLAFQDACEAATRRVVAATSASSSAPKDDPVGLQPYANPGAGCVWELGIIDFERRAWLEDVLTNPAGPDIERYLARETSADV